MPGEPARDIGPVKVIFLLRELANDCAVIVENEPAIANVGRAAFGQVEKEREINERVGAGGRQQDACPAREKGTQLGKARAAPDGCSGRENKRDDDEKNADMQQPYTRKG